MTPWAGPVVLIHAFPLDHRMWEPVAELLTSDGIDVRCIDLPGFGGTALPNSGESLTVVAEQVREHIPDGAVVVGVSLGGYVVMEILRLLEVNSAQDRLAGIALCDTKAAADDDSARSVRQAMAALADSDPQSLVAALRGGLVPRLTGASPDPEVVATLEDWVSQAHPSTVAWYQRAMSGRPDSFAVLADYLGPSIVIWGKEDVLSPDSDQLAMIEVLSRPTSARIDGAGHLACLERPREFAEVLNAWLRHLPT